MSFVKLSLISSMNKTITQLLFLLQLEEYDTKRLLLWIKTNPDFQIKQDKKKLVWTIKAKVLYTLAKLITLLGVKPLTSLVLATKTLLPLEGIFKNFIIALAKFKLVVCPNLVIIGITGSYGKTTVKEILSHLLETDYRVLKTPENYNTPLGIAKIILTKLNAQHQIFIVEMGAYQIGDIKRICSFVHPKIGILTAIGKQHWERFGSQENIIKTKSELLLSLPKDGLAVTNADNSFCLDVSKNLNIKTILYSVNPVKRIANSQQLIANDIKTSSTGSSFQIENSGEVEQFQTQLLGNHNIANILAAISVARELKVTWDKIKISVSTLSPIPHRLQLIKGANDTVVLDDAYNANPDSVRAALGVLTNFNAPRKIVVTPGLVELGNEQKKENEIMGKEIAQNADYLIIVGNTNKAELKKGFLSAKKDSDEKRVIECLDLNEATKKLQEIIIPKSVILFENDLPDQYL